MKTLGKRCLTTILVMALLTCVWAQAIVAEEIAKEDIVGLEQLSPAVRKTLVRESSGGTIGEIKKGTKEGGVIYEASVILDGREYKTTIYADGILIEKELIKHKKKKKYTRAAEGDVMTFEKNKVGSVPKGWQIAETRGKGKTATWKVISGGCDSKKAIAITENKNSGSTYNLLIAGKTNHKDIEIELKIKSMTGKQDQGGGPIWRAKDAKNYYVARWNPLEDNLRVYYVKDGRRVQLASADIKTDPSEWHQLEIKHVGNIITAKFDYQKVIEIEDTTFTEGGMAGLWTKADAATAFDDFKVEIKDDADGDDGDDNDEDDDGGDDDDVEDGENDDGDGK